MEDVYEFDDEANVWICFDYVNLDPEGEPTQTELSIEEYNELFGE
jgi:hypothetical protein